ncbi:MULTISPECIES: hypothetical protein [Metabacillus]|jgi:hypothetical protein|nr:MULTISPECIES: hypothetical protein [Metabacillus]
MKQEQNNKQQQNMQQQQQNQQNQQADTEFAQEMNQQKANKKQK